MHCSKADSSVGLRSCERWQLLHLRTNMPACDEAHPAAVIYKERQDSQLANWHALLHPFFC